jgi:hypothetical protein
MNDVIYDLFVLLICIYTHIHFMRFKQNSYMYKYKVV